MFNQRKPACFILWFTGLSGSGKSSLSVLLKRELNKKKKNKNKDN